MRTSAPCECGRAIDATDGEALVGTFLAHCRDAHPEWQASEQMVRNYLDALDRLTGPTERLEEIGSIEVHDAGGARVGEVLAFFDHDAFAGAPGWASCYCRYHHVDLSGWAMRAAAQNRSDLETALQTGATTGIVATVDGRLAGWCNASRRSSYPEHRDGSPDDHGIAAIVCFAVAPPYRGHGVARALLDAAVERLRDDGVTAIEAYPVREAASASAAYHGTVAMFAAAGFEVVADDDTHVVMRLALADGGVA